MQTKVTEAFESFTAPKKVNQCVPNIMPMMRKRRATALLIFKILFSGLIKNNKLTAVRKQRHNTRSAAGIFIILPKTAVKPQRITEM